MDIDIDIDLNGDGVFKQTFGGEGWDYDYKIDDYGFQIGDMSVTNLRGDEFAKLVTSGMNHLMLNGHRFKFVDSRNTDLPVKVCIVEPRAAVSDV